MLKGSKYIIIFRFIVSVFLYSNLEIAAQQIYVSTANNTGVEDGSILNPFNTIQKASNVASSGEIIYVSKGLYREEVRIVSNGVTYTTFDGDVIIKGTDLLDSWVKVDGGNVYKTVMNWDFLPADGGNQIFVDDSMMYLTRWPDQSSDDIVMPADAIADDVKVGGGTNTIIFTDSDFNEPDGRWNGAKIWINLSRGGADGQGLTATVLTTSLSNRSITVDLGYEPRFGIQPWGVGPGTEYYLFDPKKVGVEATGGVNALLASGEWVKYGNELFIKTFNDQPPGGENATTNVIEAKKRQFAFRPFDERVNRNNITIKGFHLFATSITTDNSFNTRVKETAEDAHDILLENINAKYVTHFTNLTGNWQDQWSGRSGIILSGKNNTMKNCTVKYSAGPAISLIGYGSKLLGNSIISANYANTNSGAVNTANWCWDCEIAYNTIYNTPMIAIAIKGFKNSNPKNKGIARVHHNIIYDFMMRGYDSGAIDQVATDGQWTRIDHNYIFNTKPEAIEGPARFGVYLDFGGGADVYTGRYIVDHNVIYNVDVPILINHIKDVLIYNNTAVMVKDPKIAIVNGNGGTGIRDTIRNNIFGGTYNDDPWGSLKDAVFEHNIFDAKGPVVFHLFEDTLNFNFTLKSTAVDAIDKGIDVSPYNDPLYGPVDIGAHERDVPVWKPGIPVVYSPVISPNGGIHLDSVTIKLHTDNPLYVIRYTLDGTDPDENSKIYTGEFIVKDSVVVKARVFAHSNTFSDVSAAGFDIFTFDLPLREPDNVSDVKQGVNAEYFPFWGGLGLMKIPDIDKFTPERVEVISNFFITEPNTSDYFIFRYTGFIEVPTDGVYTFYTSSDDGSKLFIGETLVVDNDGIHAPIEKSGFIGLKAGKHSILVEFIESSGGESISVQYKGPAITKGYIPSSILWHEDFIKRPAKVDISPYGGKFSDMVKVRLNSSTPGASIYYTLDGSIPNTTSNLYTDSITITYTSLLKAVSFVNGMAFSKIDSAFFEKSVAGVGILPDGGNFIESVSISLVTKTPDAEIFYTLDGTLPSRESQRYFEPFILNQSSTLTTVAFKTDLPQSSPSSATFVLSVAPVTLSLASDVFCDSAIIAMESTTDDALIYYTLDGKTPGETSLLYVAPVKIFATTIIKAVAFKSGLNKSSMVAKRYTKTSTGCISSIYDINDNEAAIFPNPVENGTLTLKLPAGLLVETMIDIHILDISGIIIYSKKVFYNSWRENIDIENLNNLSPGVYMLRISSKKYIQHLKFIVK